MRDAYGLQYFLTDHLGSTVAVTDHEGTLTSQQRYLPFGGVRTDLAAPEYRISNTDLGYTGQRDLDPGMGGLMDYKFRMYSPVLGRFISPDTDVPASQGVQGLNRYAYVNNNPIRYTDPTGHMIVEDRGSKRGCHDLGYCSISAEMNIKIGRDYSKEDGKILRDLLRSGNSDAKEAVDYLVNNDIPIQHVEKDALGKGVGAAWWYKKHPTEFNTLWIDDNQLQGDYNYGLSLVVHETVHLEQGATWALSVLGEQEAWQVGFKVYKDLTGQYPGKRDVAESIVNLPYDASRTTLEKARDLMLQWQPNYNANWLPLYPLDFYFIWD